jgi:hypothetical protein
MENIELKPFEIKKVQKIVESKETESLLECLESLEIHAESIGEGGNAEVLAIAEGPFSKVCLKKIKEKPQIICNSISMPTRLCTVARNCLRFSASLSALVATARMRPMGCVSGDRLVAKR